MMNRFSAYSLLRSFSCAFSGVLRALWHERNQRIHVLTAAYVLYFSRYFSLSKAEYAILFITIGLVIACEMVNTAVEAAVDLKTPVFSSLAKTAKDTAAGAVLVSAAASVAVGIALFWQPAVLAVIWRDIVSAPLVWLFLLAVTVFLVAWPERRRHENGTDKNPHIKETK